jgi:predicted DNA-binding transcriptional regulator AlpA
MEHQATSFRALRLAQVIDKINVSRSQIFRMVKDGTFPPSHNLSETGSIVAWNEAEIDIWLGAKFSEGEHRLASPEPISQLGHNGGPPLDDAAKQRDFPVTKPKTKKQGAENG